MNEMALGICLLVFCLRLFFLTAQGNVSTSQLTGLKGLYDATDGVNWRWRSDAYGAIWNFSVDNPNPCAPIWQGLTCNCSVLSCNVTSLDLRYYRLSGSIPSAVGDLVNLESLILSNNNLVDAIPDAIGSLVNLNHLDLSFNYLHGSIPHIFESLAELVFLNLRQNGLTGDIPYDIYQLSKLQFLRLNLNRLSGTVSQNISNLTELTNLELSVNNLHGEIIPTVANLTKLEYFLVHSNHFVGSLNEQFCHMKSLLYVYLDVNDLTGSLPDCMGDLQKLKAFTIEENRITGSIPETIQLLNQSLLVFYVDINFMTGTIPANLFNATNSKLAQVDLGANNFTGRLPEISLSLLHSFDIRDNHLSGTLSDSIRYSEKLYYFDVSSNQLSGTIPDKLNSLKYLNDLILSFNEFTGSLSDTVNGHNSMYQYQINNNLLTGTVPPSFCNNNPQYTELGSNYFYGPLPDCTNGSAYQLGKLIYYTVNNNLFSGSLPSYLQFEDRAVALTMNNNLFSGTVPYFNSTGALQYLYVQVNNLEGTIPLDSRYTALAYVDFSNNQFSGKLPKDLFNVNSSLISFAATSNCITGSLPKEVCDVTGLVYLELDGLTTAENCRSAIFPAIKSINTFYLNVQITGGIPQCLFAMPNLQVVHFSGNSLEWSFPSDNSLVISDSLTELLLSHNKITGTIPDLIQSRQWDLLDLSFNKLRGTIDFVEQSVNSSLVLQVNRISGGVPSTILDMESINILNGNLFGCNFQRDGLPEHDEAYSTYQCGSNSFDEASIVWAVFAAIAASMLLLVVVLHQCLKWRVEAQVKVSSYLRAFDDDPTDSIASFKKVLLHMNKCNLLLTGGILLVFLPVYGVLTDLYKTAEYQYAWTVSAAYLSGAIPAVILWLFYTAVLILLYFTWRKTKENRVYFFAMFVRAKNGKKSDVRPSRHFFLFLVVVFNCVVMVLVNGLYLRVILNGTATEIFFAQISIAFFKLLWNDFAMRWLVLLARRAYRRVTTDIITSAIDKNDKIAEEMPYTSFIILFNCILAPVLVTAAVDNDCFLNVFVPVSPVTALSPSFGVVGVCDYYIASLVGNSTCLSRNVESFVEVTYDPPFIYGYQCSSSILKNYVAVYVYMYLTVGFLKPIVLLLMHYFYTKMPERSCIRIFADNTMYELLKPPNLAALQNRRVHFFKERFVLRIVAKVSVLITFGVIFPPLSVVVCAAFASEVCLNLIMVGQFLVMIKDDVMRKKFRELLCRDCEGCMDLLLAPLVRLVVPFAAIFYSFFVFDTYGDAVGFKRAVWAPVLLCVTPPLIWLGHRVSKTLTARSLEKRTMSISRGSEMVTKNVLREKESQCEEEEEDSYFG